jgi:hypothetical protein
LSGQLRGEVRFPPTRRPRPPALTFETLERTPKFSAAWFRETARQNAVAIAPRLPPVDSYARARDRPGPPTRSAIPAPRTGRLAAAFRGGCCTKRLCPGRSRGSPVSARTSSRAIVSRRFFCRRMCVVAARCGDGSHAARDPRRASPAWSRPTAPRHATPSSGSIVRSSQIKGPIGHLGAHTRVDHFSRGAGGPLFRRAHKAALGVRAFRLRCVRGDDVGRPDASQSRKSQLPLGDRVPARGDDAVWRPPRPPATLWVVKSA